MPQSLSQFWVSLEQRRAERRISLTQLSKNLNVPLQTLVSWRERNRFRTSCLPLLATVLAWKISAAGARLKGVHLMEDRTRIPVLRHPVEDVLHRINRSYRKAERAMTQYAEGTAQVMGSLGANCFFGFSSCTVTPREFEKSDRTSEGQEFVRLLAGAVSRGTLLLYVRPTAMTVRYYQGTWGFDHIVKYDESVREFRWFCDEVKRMLVSGESGEPKMSPNEAEVAVHAGIDQCYVSRSPMWMPGISLRMLHWTTNRNLKGRVLMGMPGGEFGELFVYPQYYVIEFRVAKFLGQVVSEACEILEHGKAESPGPGNSYVGVELHDSDGQLKHRKEFYKKCSKYLRTVHSHEPKEDDASESED